MNKFQRVYKRIITEARKKKSQEEFYKNPTFEWDGNKFWVQIEKLGGYGDDSKYQAWLSGKVEGNKIYWKVEDQNTALEHSIGFSIDGETEGQIELDDINDASTYLDDLFDDFQSAFEDLSIDDYEEEEDEWDDQYQSQEQGEDYYDED